jgi:hypothetical protein
MEDYKKSSNYFSHRTHSGVVSNNDHHSSRRREYDGNINKDNKHINHHKIDRKYYSRYDTKSRSDSRLHSSHRSKKHHDVQVILKFLGILPA